MTKRYKPQRRLKPKRSVAKKVFGSRLFWFGMLALFVLGGVGYGVFFTPFFKIQHIEVQGVHKIPAEKVVELTKEYIPRKIVFFEINHLFLANASATAAHIQASFPEAEEVYVDTAFPNKVQVTIQERSAVAVWCQQKSYTVEVSDSPFGGDEQATRSWRECFALDRNGVVFEEAEYGEQVVIQRQGTSAAVGDTVLAPELLLPMLEFQKEMDSSVLFSEVGLRVVELSVISEERVNATISEGWEMYVNPAANIRWQTTKAKLVLEQEIPFTKRPQLEYIDLRFGDQAYIKYK